MFFAVHDLWTLLILSYKSAFKSQKYKIIILIFLLKIKKTSNFEEK